MKIQLPEELKKQFVAFGSEGGKLTAKNYGREHYAVIGRKGGKMSGRSKRAKLSTGVKKDKKIKELAVDEIAF